MDATEVIADDVNEELEVEAEEQAAADIAESELAEPADTDTEVAEPKLPQICPRAPSRRRTTGRSRPATRSRATPTP